MLCSKLQFSVISYNQIYLSPSLVYHYIWNTFLFSQFFFFNSLFSLNILSFFKCYNIPDVLQNILISSVQSLSHVRLFATPWTTAQEDSLSITNSWSKPKFTSIELVMPSNHLILCHSLLLLPSIFLNIRIFSNGQLFASGGQNIGVSASASVLPMNTQDWFPLGIIYIDKPEKAMAPHSSTLAWKIPWAEEPGRLQSMGSLRLAHNWESSLSLFSFTQWRRKWQPIPVFLAGESQWLGSLVGCRLWGRTESDTTEVT